MLLPMWTPAETATAQSLVATAPSALRLAQGPLGLPSASLPRPWSVPGAPLRGPDCESGAATTPVPLLPLPPPHLAASGDVDAATTFSAAVMPGLNYSMSLSSSC